MNQGLEDVGGPLRGIVLRMQIVQGQTHDRAEDTVLHSEQFRGLVERRAYTLKRINDEGFIIESVDRTNLWAVETPQIFRAELLRKAYACAYDPAFTDDATVVEAAGGVLRLVEGETTNLKITTRDDLAVAEAILARRTEA